MIFSQQEHESLLAITWVAPTVIHRLEQIGIDSLTALANADVYEVVGSLAGLVGATCWKNSPRACMAIQACIDLANKNKVAQPDVGRSLN